MVQDSYTYRPTYNGRLIGRVTVKVGRSNGITYLVVTKTISVIADLYVYLHMQRKNVAVDLIILILYFGCKLT